MRQIINPWNEISPENYENHMGSQNVLQLQVLNAIMKEQMETIDEEIRNKSTVAILGITNGNGSEHILPLKIGKVIGIDINQSFLDTCAKRYDYLKDSINLYAVDLMIEKDRARNILDNADLIIANLVIEHIHLDNFIEIIKQLRSRKRTISCVIQYNPDGSLISNSGYEHTFDSLIPIIEEAQEDDITNSVITLGYKLNFRKIYDLPNGKILIRLDYTK